MFREIVETNRKKNGPRRRWFSSPPMDLFVWLDENDEIVGYQLTYDKPHDEKALVWDKDKGFSHLGVDDGFRPGRHPASPMLIEDGDFLPGRVISMIAGDDGELAPWIGEFIISGIRASYGPDE